MVALQKVTWEPQVDGHSPKSEGHSDCTLTVCVCVCERERDAGGRVKVRTEKEGDALGSCVVGGIKRQRWRETVEFWPELWEEEECKEKLN